MMTPIVDAGYRGREATYLTEVVKRLKPIYEDLSELECLGLIDVLTTFRFRLKDGFVINHLTEDSQMIGRREASAIVCCLSASEDSDARTWKAKFDMQNKSDPAFVAAMEQMLGRIVRQPNVHLV